MALLESKREEYEQALRLVKSKPHAELPAQLQAGVNLKIMRGATDPKQFDEAFESLKRTIEDDPNDPFE